MEVSENILCLQLRFQCDTSGPLIREDSLTKTDLDVTQSFDVVFSSDRSVYEFSADRCSPNVAVGGSFTIGYDWD